MEKIKQNTLYLVIYDSFSYDSIRIKGYHIEKAFRTKSFFSTAICEIYNRIDFLPFQSIWYNNWKNRMSGYDTIIVSAFNGHCNIVKWIAKKYPQKRIIFYYEDILSDMLKTKGVSDDICEKWTMDIKDADKYRMKFNPFYYAYDEENMLPRRPMQDVLFVGRDKGRYNELKEIQGQLEKLELTTKFYIMPSHIYQKYKRGTKYKKCIPYSEILKMINESKAILDIVQENQTGITIRPLEALFFHKKLITNNKNIVSYKFYCQNNIFIIGKDDINTLKEFMELPWLEIDKEVSDFYTFPKWIERFFS